MLNRKLIIAFAGCLLTASVQSVAQNTFQLNDESMFDMSTLSNPHVIAESDLFLAEPVGTEGLMSMNVRIITAGGKLVFDEQTDGGPVSLFITELNLPDGRYRYEVNAVYDIGSSGKRFISPFTSSRGFGIFTIQDGLIANSRANAVTGDDSVSDNNNVSWPVRLAGITLDWLIADASAANSGVAAHNNTCVGDASCDDTSIPGNNNGDLGTSDFVVLDVGGQTDLLMTNDTKSLLFNLDGDIFTIFNDTDSNILMEMNLAGDVILGNGSVFIDESGAAMHIGATTAPLGSLMVTGNSGGVAMTLFDSVNNEANLFIQDGNQFFITYSLSTVPFAIKNAAPSDAFVIGSSGNIGFGTATPSSAVDVVRSAGAASFKLTSSTDTANQAPQFVQRRSRGTSAAPAALGLGDNIGLVSFRGHTGSGYSGTKATVAAQATEDWTPTSNGTRLIFGTTENGTTTLKNVLEITHDGKVKINGTTLNVPDYVFEEDYQLMSLDELAMFIEENKHLPGVASANEVNTGGLDIADSQLSVLEKVEELTLYTLQQHETLKQLDRRNAQLQASNAQLKASHRELLAAYQTQQKKLDKVDQLEEMVHMLMQRDHNGAVLTAAN